MKRGRNMDRGDPVLPEDLMTEILSRVELKVLMRLRCVSKAWNSLVLDPIFVKLHLKRSSNSPHTLLFSNVPHLWIGFFSTHSVLENPTSTINDHSRFFIHHQCFFGSCNGLVCLHDYSVHGTFEKHWVLFWNPATRIFSQPSPRLCLPSTDYNTCVFFGLGFGYDDWSNTYKAVVILLNMKTRQMELKVHSMGDTCWTNILTCPAFSITKKVGQFVSGTLNWIALVHHMEEFVIFSYDLKNETCRYSSMPVGLSEAPSCSAPHLGVLKGCLSVSVNKRTDYVVWLMREFGVETSWTKLLNVSYQHLQIYCLFPNVRTLCMSEDEDVMLLASDYSAQFIFYNKRDNRVDHIQGSNIGCYKFFSHDYVQSLVLPY